jgi:hypothetical protein
MTDKIIRGTVAYYCITVFSQYNYWHNSAILGSIALFYFLLLQASFCPMYALFGHSSSSETKK